MKRLKGYVPKRRKARNRKLKRILLIKAEGKNETEKNYFRSFHSNSFVVKICRGNETDPVNMAKQLIAEYKKYALEIDDLAVCLVDSDFDEQKNKQMLEADRLLTTVSQENIKMYVSSPCFEIWFLCHFCYPNRNYASNKEVIADLAEKMDGYTKSDTNIFKKLAGKEAVAVNNAKRLEQECREQGKKHHTVAFRNSTEVYKIFEKQFLQTE